MHLSFFIVALLGSVTQTQARSRSTRTKSNMNTNTNTTSPIVIAGSCDQNTLQYCCPLITPIEGESSVDFATDCMNGNLPASYDCFYEFENFCCGGSGSCEVVPPVGDICAPGAAGTIVSAGAVSGASTVTSTVDCATATATSTPTGSEGSASTTTSS